MPGKSDKQSNTHAAGVGPVVSASHLASGPFSATGKSKRRLYRRRRATNQPVVKSLPPARAQPPSRPLLLSD